LGPLGFLTGVVLGSAASISGVLAMVLIVFLVVSSDHPALLEEYAPLVRAVVLFGVLAAVAGAAFIGLQKKRRWRWLAQGAMWATLAAIAWSYWPAEVA
jgi:uncharacterized membrane protein